MKFNSLLLLSLAFYDASEASPAKRGDLITERLENGLGRTPALGWNNYNIGGCPYATAAAALNTARLFVSLGLKDLGYNYVNIDDCWSTKSRNGTGHLVPDPAKWPNGIKSVADQIHGMGLKFGLYGDAGTLTCAGYPGSEGHEAQDVQTIASWGVDYWKYDNCYTPCVNGARPQTCYTPSVTTKPWYGKMRDALKTSNRPMLYSLCQWGRESVWTWGKDYGNSWRMSNDIANSWQSLSSIASAAAGMSQYAAPGGFNDLDMMQLGNGALNENEERAHMGLWAIAKSPIILGTDLSKVKSSTLNIIRNKGLIAINQDKLGKAATYFRPNGAQAPVNGQLYPYWAGPLSDGVVVGVVAASGAQTLSFKFADVPGLGDATRTYKWTEVYTGATGTSNAVTTSLAAHDMRVYKVTK